MSKNKKLNFQGLGLDIDDDLNRITKCDHKANATNMRAPSRQYHALPANDQIQALVEPDTMHLVLPSACISNMELHHETTDMTGKMTPEGRRILVRYCVKNVLFRRLKFFKKIYMECTINAPLLFVALLSRVATFLSKTQL